MGLLVTINTKKKKNFTFVGNCGFNILFLKYSVVSCKPHF